MSGLPNQSTPPHDYTSRSLPCTRHELRIKLENDACRPPLYSQNKRTKLAPNLNPFSRRVSRTHMATLEEHGEDVESENELAIANRVVCAVIQRLITKEHRILVLKNNEVTDEKGNFADRRVYIYVYLYVYTYI